MRRELILITIVFLLIGAVMVIAQPFDFPSEDAPEEIPMEMVGGTGEGWVPSEDKPEGIQIKTGALPEDDPFAQKDDEDDPFATVDDDDDPFAISPITPTEKKAPEGKRPKDWTQDYDLKDLKTMTEAQLTIVWEDWKFGLITLTDEQQEELERLPFMKTIKIREAAKGTTKQLWSYLDDNVWVMAGFAYKAYKEYGNFLSFTSLFPGFSQADVQARKDWLNQKFCVIGGLTKCIKSWICEQTFDIVAGQEVVGRDPIGQYVNVANIKGYKIGPITIKGLPRQTLKDWFGDKTVIQGILYDFTDPSFDSSKLPEQDIYLYQVQYVLSNPFGAQEREFGFPYVPASTTQKYNLRFERGTKKPKWWGTDQRLEVGKTATDNILKYSFTDYEKVCLTFQPGFRSWSQWDFGDPIHKACDKFESYAGVPTQITGHPSQANPATQSSGTPGQNI